MPSTYYIDLINGDDDADGSTFDLSNLTLRTGSAIPPMTSLTTPSGYIASSDTAYDALRTAWKPFSGHNNDANNDGWVSANAVFPHYLQVQIPEAQTFVAYRIQPTTANKCFTAWILYGSNNGTDWDELDSQTGQTSWAWPRCNIYTFSNSTAYLYYKIIGSAGNDSNYGRIGQIQFYTTNPSIVGPWRSGKYGATSARTAAGDMIKYAKSPDEVSSGINATFTLGSSTVTLASALTKDICNCDSAWTGAENVTATANTSNVAEGTAHCKLVVAAGFTTGKIAYFALPSELNLSAYQKISFFMTSSTYQPPGRFRICLCSDATGDVPVNSFYNPTLLSARDGNKYPFTIDNGSALGSNINSISIWTDIDDPGTPTIYLDNFIACNDFSLQSLVGVQNNVFYTIRCITDDTTVKLGIPGGSVIIGAAQSFKWYGSSGSHAFYYRNPVQYPYLATAYDSTMETFRSGGSSTVITTHSGGWNTTSGEQDGMTLVDAMNGSGYLFVGNSYTLITNLWAIRAYYSYYGATIGLDTIQNMGIHGCDMNGILWASTNISYHFLSGFINIIGNSFGTNGGLTIDAGSYESDSDADFSMYSNCFYSCTPITVSGQGHRFTGTWTLDVAAGQQLYLEKTFDVSFRKIVYINSDTGPSGYPPIYGNKTSNVFIETIELNCNTPYIAANPECGINRIGYVNMNGHSVTSGAIYSGNSSRFRSMFWTIDVYGESGRWVAHSGYGMLTDPVTAGLTQAWSYGGSGNCMVSYMWGLSSAAGWMKHFFYGYVEAGNTYRLSMMIKKSSGEMNTTLDILSIVGCGITPIEDVSVTPSLTTDWTEFTTDTFTATISGFVRVDLKFAMTSIFNLGHIGLDSITMKKV